MFLSTTHVILLIIHQLSHHMDFSLESRCKIVTEVYKVSRDIMLTWFDAARSGDLKTMKYLYKQISSTTTTSSKQQQQHPLVHATGEGTSYGFIGSTVLHWAAANGDIPMMKQLLDEWGASPNAQNKGGSTPLHSACSNLRVQSASFLIQKGANPDLVDCCNDSPSDVLKNRLEMEEEMEYQEELEAMMGSRGSSSHHQKKKTSTRSITEEILTMLRVQSLAMKMLKNRPNSTAGSGSPSSSSSSSWSTHDMRKLAVGCKLYSTEDECPKEKSELVKVCEMALGHFSLQLDLASSSDSSFERLKAECEDKIQKRLLDLEKKQQRKLLKKQNKESNIPNDDSDEDDEDEDDEAFELEMLQKKATQSSDKGNSAFSAGNFKLAVQHYTTAISLAPHESKYYSNRAAAYLKMKVPKKALEDAKVAASLKPDWAKPYHRWGCAALDLGLLSDSVAAFKLGLERAAGDTTLISGLESVMKELERKRGANYEQNDQRRNEEGDDESDERDDDADNDEGTKHREDVIARKLPSSANESFIPIHERKPWFECKICENRTRDSGESPCCKKLVCGTCVKRWKRPCPFGCGK